MGREVRRTQETSLITAYPKVKAQKEGGRGVFKALYALSVFPGPGGDFHLVCRPSKYTIPLFPHHLPPQASSHH